MNVLGCILFPCRSFAAYSKAKKLGYSVSSVALEVYVYIDSNGKYYIEKYYSSKNKCVYVYEDMISKTSGDIKTDYDNIPHHEQNRVIKRIVAYERAKGETVRLSNKKHYLDP